MQLTAMYGLRALSALSIFTRSAVSLTLSITSPGNASSPLLFGLLYEDIYHSGDGGMYAELIRNRAFQGSADPNGSASLTRNTAWWNTIGGVELEVDTSTPTLSSALPYQLKLNVPENATGLVGLYNEGFWGFDVDSSKRYAASVYLRGNYTSDIFCAFRNNLTGSTLGTVSLTPNNDGSKSEWTQFSGPAFYPSETASDPNNTFHFLFDGEQLAGQSIYLNLFSLFKQTYLNRYNGLREDLAESVLGLNAKYMRLPGGNNMEGLYSPFYWKWNETLGSLTSRPGRPGTWGDVNTDGLGILEQLQWTLDMGLVPILGVWAGLYLDGEIVSEADFQPYVDMVVNELEFLLGDSSTTYGSQRAKLGYPDPFNIPYVEIGNEDFLNGGIDSYYSYRYNMMHDAIRPLYPNLTLISTINPNPQPVDAHLDLHIYGNADYISSLYNTFDQASRSFPVWVNEYACTAPGGESDQVGAQTIEMAAAEAVFLMGCERNSDIVKGTAYGALIKEYNDQPETVSVIKHTANEILQTMSYYVQKLFEANHGTSTATVDVTDGSLGPVFWSATQNSTSTILKLVNYGGNTGEDNAVDVMVEGSIASTAILITMTAPNTTSVNNLPSLGGEANQFTTTTLSSSSGSFSVSFSQSYEIAILVV